MSGSSIIHIMDFKGHSGCKINLCSLNDKLFVRKISKSPDYNDRLAKQMLLQDEYAKKCRAPKVYGQGVQNDLFYFDMEYINSESFALALESMDFEVIQANMNSIIQGFNTENEMETHPEVFREKIDSLKLQLKNNPVCLDALSWLHDQFNNIKGSPNGHGDLTLENILIENSTTLYFIDFLDSFFHSWKMDCAKLLQDLELGWSWRHNKIPPALFLNMQYARKILTDFIINQHSYEIIRQIYLLLMLNIIRIVPYCHDKTTFDWCMTRISLLLIKLKSNIF